MKRIYDAANNIEAHMIAHLLSQAGIRAYVQGEHLQSGAGELPLGNLAGVAVDDQDVEAARRVIRDWEAQNAPSADAPQQSAAPSAMQGLLLAFVCGVLVGGAAVWSLDRSAMSSRTDCPAPFDEPAGPR